MKLFSLRVLVLALFALIPLIAEAQTPQVAAAEEDDDPPPPPSELYRGCTSYSGHEVRVEYFDSTPNVNEGRFRITIRDHNNTVIYNELLEERSGCDWFWEMDEEEDTDFPSYVFDCNDNDTCVDRSIVNNPIESRKNIWKITVDGKTYIYGNNSGLANNSFYFPGDGSGSGYGTPDMTFVIDGDEVKAGGGISSPGGVSTPDNDFYEDCFSGDYVIPHNADYYSSSSCNSNTLSGGRSRFISTSSTIGYYTFASESDVLVSSEYSGSWNVPGLVLRFPQSRKLVVEDDLNIIGATLTATNPSQGWKGIRYEPGSSGELTNVGIANVKGGPVGHALLVYNADVMLSSTDINGSGGDGGVYATGGSASVVISGDSDITNHLGYGSGVVADNGAYVQITDEQVNVDGNYYGVRASGVGGELMISSANVLNNLGTGAMATSGGSIDFCDDVYDIGSPCYGAYPYGEPQYTTGTHVQANHGGLRAETAAYIATGWWDYPNNGDKPGGGNRSGYYDAFSFEWSTVGAANVYWGESNYSDIYQFEEEATLNTWPYYATAPAALTEAPIDVSSFQIAAARSADAPGAARPGEEPAVDPLHATVVEAERLRSLGKIDEATELLHTGLMEATTERERGVLASTAVRLLGSPRTPRKRTVLHDWAEPRAEGAGPDRPWALRMLTAAHLYDEGAQEAERYARRLLAEPSRHRVFAHEILARVATERGDERAAMGHLGALAALNERAASDAARGISAAFDAADPEVVVQRARVEAARSAQVEAIGVDEADGALRVGVAPNPATEAVEITVTGDAALSSVQVYDTLGRRVLDADEASRLDVAQLPAGVYIVQVATEDGRMATTRFTVTR